VAAVAPDPPVHQPVLLIYREYGIDPLERHIVAEVMSRDVATIDGEDGIADALERHFGPTQTHRAFPVLVGARFIGMMDRDTLIDGLRRHGNARIADLFGANVPAMALPDENCRTIATRLAVHGLERLPVVSDAQSRRLVGLIARSDLIKPSLAVGDEEAVSERFFELPFDAAKSRFRALTGAAADAASSCGPSPSTRCCCCWPRWLSTSPRVAAIRTMP
jgi:CBS domain-containing protein